MNPIVDDKNSERFRRIADSWNKGFNIIVGAPNFHLEFYSYKQSNEKEYITYLIPAYYRLKDLMIISEVFHTKDMKIDHGQLTIIRSL